MVVLGFEDARSARNRTRAAEGKPFFVYPADIPNTGVLFVDRQKEDRSGHGHNSIAECRNGDIIALSSVKANGAPSPHIITPNSPLPSGKPCSTGRVTSYGQSCVQKPNLPASLRLLRMPARMDHPRQIASLTAGWLSACNPVTICQVGSPSLLPSKSPARGKRLEINLLNDLEINLWSPVVRAITTTTSTSIVP